MAAVYSGMQQPQSWLTLSKNERWRMTLFPLLAEISRCRDKNKLLDLMSLRLQIISALLKFVFDTKRFPEAKVDKAFYEI